MKKVKGFTLIEVLVIISIITVMTVALFSNYGKNNEMFALERSAQKLAQDIRRAQDMAMAGSTGTGGTSTYGYGLYFDKLNSPNSYIIYEEKDDDGLDVNMAYDGESIDHTKESISLENGIKICTLINTAPPSVDVLSVSFEPPNPLTYIDGVPSGKTAVISLCITSDVSKTRTITINNAGMVQVTK